ncbi:MAG TPA: STAS domain-containing protein [Acidimicrobiia bacterium]
MIETPEHDASPSAPPEGDDSAEFGCETTVEGGRATLRFRGELDLATSPVLERDVEAAFAPGISEVVLYLSRVGFMDSSGLASLIAARRSARARGVRFALGPMTRQCRMTIELSGLDDLFELEG